jgi:exonuclease III
MSWLRTTPKAPAQVKVADFSVATYNLNSFAFRNPDDPLNESELNVLDGIGTADADVVFLQETHERWEEAIRAHLPQYTTLVFCHSQASDGIGAIAKKGVQLEFVDHLYPDVDRSWFAGLLTRFRKSERHEWIYVINVHLRPPNQLNSLLTTGIVRKQECQYLYKHLMKFLNDADRRHIMVVGDFNEGHGGDAVKWLLGDTTTWNNQPEMGDLYDKFGDALLEYDGSSHTWSWPVWRFISLWGPYDHLFYTKSGMEAISCRVLKEYDWVSGSKKGSDHMPVVATFRYL